VKGMSDIARRISKFGARHWTCGVSLDRAVAPVYVSPTALVVKLVDTLS
jgi:hypothetical protein